MIYKYKNKQIKLPERMVKMQDTWAVAWSQDNYLTIPHPDGEQDVILSSCYIHQYLFSSVGNEKVHT